MKKGAWHYHVLNAQLLRSWREGDEQEQRDTWEYLKRVLEEDRFSNRRIATRRQNYE